MVERGNLWSRAGHAIEQLRKIHSGERDMCSVCYSGEDCSYRYLVSLVDELKIEDEKEFGFWAMPIAFFWALGLGGGWLTWLL